MISERASDSLQDLTYAFIDKNQKIRVLLFDVINDEIQAVHLARKGLICLMVTSVHLKPMQGKLLFMDLTKLIFVSLVGFHLSKTSSSNSSLGAK